MFFFREDASGKRALSFESWTSCAFLGFVSFVFFLCFFLEFHPQCAQGILKYLHLIRSAASHFNSPCARVIITDDVMYMSLVTDQKSIIGISIKEGPFQKSLKSRYVSFC